jgi:hypothetical protein
MSDREHGNGHGNGHGQADTGGGRGRSELSPGHRKHAAGAQSARDYAPGRGSEPPGEMNRNDGDAATEKPEPDSLERET